MNAWTGAANVFAEQPTSPTRRRDLTVRPTSILDPRFRYVPSNCTDVTITWRRFGFNPQRNAERRGKIGGHSDPQACNFLCEDSDNSVAKRKIFTSAAQRFEITAHVPFTVLLKVLEENEIGMEVRAGPRRIFLKQAVGVSGTLAVPAPLAAVPIAAGLPDAATRASVIEFLKTWC